MASKKLFCLFSFANFIDNYRVAKENYMDEKGEIILYQPDEQVRLEVRLEDETVWLSIDGMSQLFGRDNSVIGKHIRNIFKEGELVKNSVSAKFAYTASGDKSMPFVTQWILMKNTLQ